jgi:predicted nuclease of predicted toxin-antitoxin system
MRFLADECCPAPVVYAMRAAGHDVVYGLEWGPGLSDLDIVHAAQDEDRIVVTEDYDFGEIAIRRRMSIPGLVILSFVSRPAATRIDRTLATIALLSEDLRSQVTLIYATGHRRRPLRAE